MKKTLCLLALSIITLISGAQTVPIFRGPPVSQNLISNLITYSNAAQNQEYSETLHLEEGENSDYFSSFAGMYEYFAVYVQALPDHGTVLRMDPIVYYRPIHFHDMVNNTDYYVAFGADTFTIAGQTIWVDLNYWYSADCPYINLTWGNGSGVGNLGAVCDDFDFAVANINPPPTIMQLAIVNSIGLTNVPDGKYVAVNAPDENYTLQSTTDHKSWTNEPAPFYILGYIGLHYYPSTNTMSGYKFFRSKR